MVAELQELLGITAPVQFDPVMTVIAALFFLLSLSFFAEVLKLIIFRR